MPVFNERNTVEAIIRRVLAVPLRIELIVVDDGSTDGSSQILDELRKTLRFELLRGRVSPAGHAQEIELVKALLRSGKEPHYAQFLAAWETPA